MAAPNTGANVSKTNAYAVTAPPQGAGVSKTGAYAVTAPPQGASVSKTLAYAAVTTSVFGNVFDGAGPCAGNVFF